MQNVISADEKKILSKTEHEIPRNLLFKIYILKLRKNDKFSIIRIKLMINLLEIEQTMFALLYD